MPTHTLSDAQVRKALRLRGKMLREEVARKVNCSLASLSRYARAANVSFSAMPYATQPDMVAKVLAYYRAHGKHKTAKRFPKVNIRSVVERYGVSEEHKRQVRWTSGQVRELARMGGLVPFAEQAQFFARPGAGLGSIKSFWGKRVGCGPSQLHGMPLSLAAVVCHMPLRTVTVRGNAEATAFAVRKLVLWVDALGHVRADAPAFIHDAIVAMAGFQLWLFNTENPRAAILRMMRQRSGPVRV